MQALFRPLRRPCSSPCRSPPSPPFRRGRIAATISPPNSKNQIDGLEIGKTAANQIYLSHPQAKQITLGCAGRNYQNQFYAKADARKPAPAFIDLVASAAALTFTLPKNDMTKGTTRCIKQMGLLRGDDVKLRYRRLDFRCVRTRTDAAITITREADE